MDVKAQAPGASRPARRPRAHPARVAATMARKELRDILRERTIVVALLVQLFVAGFSTLLSVGLIGLYDPSSVRSSLRADVSYSGPGDNASLLPILESTRLDVHRESAEAGLASFRAGQRLALVQETVEPSGRRNLTIVVADGDVQSTLLVTQVQGLLEKQELALRQANQARLTTTIQHLDAPRAGRFPFAFLYGTLLPLLVLTPVFLSGAIAGDSFQHEVQTKSLSILRSTPASLGSILVGKLVVPVLLAPAQVLLWCGLLALNGAPVANLPLVLAVAAAMALLLCSLGLAVTTTVKRQGQSQAVYAVLSIAIAVTSLSLPRPPLNLFAAIATRSLDAATWTSLAILGAACLAGSVAALAYGVRRLRRDPA